jgi:predicted KAP-like P-loop ATPase
MDKEEGSAKGNLQIDHPLKVGTALNADMLSRSSFAQSVANVLQRVTTNGGLVVSVEGAWGSGKTSLLAMIEEILIEGSIHKKPIVVHFNPWLIGDRDALLRQFLASIAKEVSLGDKAKEGKRVANEIKTYSKAFDVLKLIPGAEPWASMIKSVVEAVGETTSAVADYKTPDIEARKSALEKHFGNLIAASSS